MLTEGFADQTLEAITLNGQLYTFLANHQAQAWMIESVFTGKKQDILARDLAAG